MKLEYKDLGPLASDVWTASCLEQKKAKMLVLIESMRFKGKAEEFKRKLTSLIDGRKIDKFAADIVLCDTDKVIKEKNGRTN